MENILEILLPLIIIIAYVFPKITGKKSATKSEEPKKARLGIFDKLNEMFKEYYEPDDEKAQYDDPDDSYVWPPVVQEADQSDSPSSLSQTASISQEQQPDQPVNPVNKEISSPLSSQQIDTDQRLRSNGDDRMTGCLSSFKKPGKQKLRNAIIWSEILSPPKALRDD